MGFGERVGFTGGAYYETSSVGELGEIFETVSVEREVVGDGYFRKS